MAFYARPPSQSAPSGPNPGANFEMPAYTSHTARRSPPRSKPSPSRSPKRASSNNSSGSSTSSDRALLDMLRSTVTCLREKRMDLEALGCLEQGLWLQRRMLGADNPQVRAALEEVVLGLNALAMQFLTTAAAFDQCLALLRKAEAITAPGNFSVAISAPLQVLTLNNLGCCYRKLGKPRAALRYLQEAARIGGAISDEAARAPGTKSSVTVVVNLSVTHLNLCAIQSQLGRHELALEHAQAAIFHAQDELVRLEEGGGARLDEATREEKLISLAVAYHNLAVELEFNGRGDASLQWFRKALELANRYRERNAALCASFQRALDDAKRKHSASRPKSAGRPMQGGRPQRPASSKTRETNLSYEATVASRCYRPAPPSTGATNPSNSSSGSATGPGGAGTARRQRPLSASSSSARTRRPMSGRLYGSSSTSHFNQVHSKPEPTIDRHWRKLEEQYDLDNTANSTQHHGESPSRAKAGTSTSSPSQNFKQIRRPHSASGASSKPRYIRQTNAAEDENDDCEVYEDEDPSDEEERLPQGTTNKVVQHQPEDSPNCSPSTRLNNGRRHREALDYSRSSTSLESGGESECHQSNGDIGDAGDASSGYGGEDDDSDMPKQRISHMAYLRRMKQIAENIRDDIGSPHRPASVDKVKQQQQTSVTKSSAKEDELVETPRTASLSKMRAKLERMRSDSLLSLLDQRDDNELENPSQHLDNHAVPVNNKLAQPAPNAPTLMIVEDGGISERELIRNAAALVLQRVFRSAFCRERIQKTKKLEEEKEAARKIQRQVRRHHDYLLDRDRHEAEDLALLLLQREEVHDIAASIIQQAYRNRLQQFDWPTRHPHESRQKRDQSGDKRSKDIATCCIQRASRRYLARQRLRRSQARRLSRQYIERRHFDLALARATRAEQTFLEEISATKIQALVRGHQSRSLTESTLIGLHAAASRIQGSFRTHRHRCSSEASFGARSIAARVLQRYFRSVWRRCENIERQEVEGIAAGTIQRFWRSRQNKPRPSQPLDYGEDYFDDAGFEDDVRLEQEEAATCIQALSRGHLARKSVQSLRASSASLSASGSTYSVSGDTSSRSVDQSVQPQNSSFLPTIARDLYVQAFEQMTVQRLIQEENQIRETYDSITNAVSQFSEWIPELEEAVAIGDTLRSSQALAAMQVIAVQDHDRIIPLPLVLQVAQHIDERLVSDSETYSVAMSLLFAFRHLLTKG